MAGGRMMVEEGLFERFPMSRVFGMHNWPALTEGVFAWREGPTMAAVANVEITVTGKGAHGAHPENGVDPVVVASAIVTALQSIVSRSLRGTDAAIVTIGSIQGGSIHNVIPETVRMLGTARWFDPAVGDVLEAGVHRLASGIATSFGASAEVLFERMYPATVNEPESTQLARQAALAVAGEARVRHMDTPTLGGEDFSFMLNAKGGQLHHAGRRARARHRHAAPPALRLQRRHPAAGRLVLRDAGRAAAADAGLGGRGCGGGPWGDRPGCDGRR